MSLESQVPAGAAAEMFDLQVAQFRHDEFYHREISRLTVSSRLNHMALHFCKYVGQLTEAISVNDEAMIGRTIVDAFIIDLCSANALNLRLWLAVPEAQEATSLTDLARRLARTGAWNIDASGTWMIFAYAVEAGRFARACEKIDHLEAFTFRETITQAVGQICRIGLVAAYTRELPLVQEVSTRLRLIKEKFMFNNAF